MTVRREPRPHTPTDELPADAMRRIWHEDKVNGFRAAIDIAADDGVRRRLLDRLDRLYENAAPLRSRDREVRRLRAELRAAITREEIP